jgi:hypothetical protein
LKSPSPYCSKGKREEKHILIIEKQPSLQACGFGVVLK